MSITIRDESLITTLSATTEPQEVHSADGRAIGQFVLYPSAKMTYPEFGMTDEELKSRANNPNAIWRTPEEVMERLRQLRKAE